MKKPLLDVIFASEKRKQVLLLLQDGAKEMEAILNSLDTTRQALLPQMKVLQEHYLVSHDKDIYELTTIGKLIVDEMKHLLSTVDVLDFNANFWGGHDLGFIPPELMVRISELDTYQINEPSMPQVYELNENFNKKTVLSHKTFVVTTIFHSNFMELFALWTHNEVEITMIISEELFDKLMAQNRSNFQEMLNSSHIKFYLYKGPFNFVDIALNDYCILLSMLKKDGLYDRKDLISYSSTALKWGKELFEYYMKDSIPITVI